MINKVMTINQILTTHKIVIKVIVRKVTNKMLQTQNHNDTYVTRDNVIDIVESYEGEYLDTDNYTYKEPEKRGNGEWGFSFTDKDGDLVVHILSTKMAMLRSTMKMVTKSNLNIIILFK